MKILKNKRNNYTISLQIEEAPEKLVTQTEKAFQKLVKSTKIKGFRKGKAPRHIFEKTYGKDVLIQEAMTNVVNDAYLEAIKELDLKVVDYPKNVDIEEYKEDQPITFTCDVDVEPEMKVKKYKGIKVKSTAKSISDEDVENEIKKNLENHVDYLASEKPAETDDIMRCDLETTLDKKEFAPWTRTNFGFKLGLASFGKEFDEKLIGAKKDDSKTFSIKYPEDFENADVAGKKLEFKVSVKEIMKKTYPELTDALVKEKLNGESAETYKTSIKEQLESKNEKESKEKLHQDIMEEILKDVKGDIPPKMVENETENSLRYFEQTLGQSGMRLDQFLAMQNKTLDGFKEELKETSEKKVKIKLVMDHVAKEENISVEENHLIDEIESWKLPNLANKEDIQKYLKQIDTQSLSDSVLQKRVYQFLEDNAKISK